MNRYAMIKDGAEVVENVVVWDDSVCDYGSPLNPFNPEGYMLINVQDKPEIGPGWGYVDGEFTEPNFTTQEEAL